MRKYQLYAPAILTAFVLGVSGCASQANAADRKEAATQESREETAVEDTTVVESVTGTIESMAETQPEASQAIRIYGPVTKLEDGQLSIDNQSGLSSSGEIILNVSSERTYILDAVTGLPVAVEDIADGDTVYTYIGPAMTMSLPPITNAEVIFVNIPADFKVPDYVQVDSMITDGESSQSVLTGADGTQYTLSEDCNILPYLTRNIVTLDDLTKGRKCIVWSDEHNTAEKIMVFAE